MLTSDIVPSDDSIVQLSTVQIELLTSESNALILPDMGQGLEPGP
jgi:hypothetical protein